MAGARANRAEARAKAHAGGVVYTPDYVVDHMVELSLAPLLRERAALGTAPPRRALAILDPACGEGAFLLGAYDHLLRWRRARGAEPSVEERRRLVLDHLFGLDADGDAVERARRALSERVRGAAATGPTSWLEGNIRRGDALIDSSHDELATNPPASDLDPFDWDGPAGFDRRFDLVIGNPPYRRERDFKDLLDRVAASEFGRRHRSPRMDLWHYFVHRGLDLLRPGGRLCFIVNAYWLKSTGADGMIARLRDEVCVEDIYDLGALDLFAGVSGRHLILTVRKGPAEPTRQTRIRRVPAGARGQGRPWLDGRREPTSYLKAHAQLFSGDQVDIEAPADELLARLAEHPPLSQLAEVRQGIAENPADINARTNAKFGGRYRVGEGVFSLRRSELEALGLGAAERRLVRPYHDLGDLGRYWSRDEPSRWLIHSTASTCPDIEAVPRIRDHLARFRPIMEQRRETRRGTRAWWQLHWPRDPRIWEASKIIALNFAPRPAFCFRAGPSYVPFSANVIVPRETCELSPLYLLGLLNSRLLWRWFRHHAKRRGVGLELGGGVLRRAPIARASPEQQGEVVALVEELRARHRRARLGGGGERGDAEAALARTDARLDALVCELYGLDGREADPHDHA